MPLCQNTGVSSNRDKNVNLSIFFDLLIFFPDKFFQCEYSDLNKPKCSFSESFNIFMRGSVLTLFLIFLCVDQYRKVLIFLRVVWTQLTLECVLAYNLK